MFINNNLFPFKPFPAFFFLFEKQIKITHIDWKHMLFLFSCTIIKRTIWEEKKVMALIPLRILSSCKPRIRFATKAINYTFSLPLSLTLSLNIPLFSFLYFFFCLPTFSFHPFPLYLIFVLDPYPLQNLNYLHLLSCSYSYILFFIYIHINTYTYK